MTQSTPPTTRDIDALIGPATPHFAYQIRTRVRNLVADLPADHPVRAYAEARVTVLDGLGFATSKGEWDDPSQPH